ncbi:MAG: hypothetical protein L3K09_00335 [Thermoplasmata archaeon]|nr:hypothetical protein [Thermoplasmata archaeon]
MLSCPFCGAPETARLDLEGSRFLVFGCQFTPKVDPSWTDPELAQHLKSDFPATGSEYFRGVCDRLHLYVTRGAGGRELQGSPAVPRDPS